MAETMAKARKLFITGTDTGIGKTVLAYIIMRYLYDKGHTPFYLKPFQTGCSDANQIDSDARFIYAQVATLTGCDPADSIVYCLDTPKAPLFAARDQHETLSWDVVRQYVQKKEALHSHLIIEGAGGVLVPIDDEMMMADAIQKLNAVPVIAARSGLGTINHTLLTIAALREKGISPCGVVMIEADMPTPPDMVAENMDAIQQFSNVPVLGVVGHIEDFNRQVVEWYPIVERLLRRCTF